jgi:predicted metal-dependent HD superfamily phosphohydrolase
VSTPRWPLTGSTELRDDLLAAYSTPGRAYHDLRHLGEVLERVEELRTASTAPPGVHRLDRRVIDLALWFHDAVYDTDPGVEGEVKAVGAEELSAQWAERALPATVLGAEAVAEVARLVRLTATHDPQPHDLAGQLVCDADLAILAAQPVRYGRYVADVRLEYRRLDDETFNAGRVRILRALLARRRLFATDHADQSWRQAAEQNIRAELARLTAGAGQQP